ncbi:MAG: ABC transporter substrate-binding protein [Planctomycetaceae bacterium]
MPNLVLVLCVLLMSFPLCGCGSGSTDARTDVATATPTDPTATASTGRPSVSLALNWYAEAEHGGYVAARELGFFQDAGLDVTIRPGGPGAPNLVIQELASERLEFAVSNADLVVLGRANGVPLVAVAAPLQQSPRCIVVRKDSGIERLDQLQDLELAISDSRPFALWMKKKLPLTNVTMVPYSGQVGEFLVKPKFAQQGYVFSEPFVIREAGGDATVLMLSDIGFNPYGSLLVTTEDVIRSKPELVRSMVQASVRGWQVYLQDPEPTNRRIHADNREMSLAALAYGAQTMKDLYQPEQGQPLCGMNRDRWQTLIEQIAEVGEIQITDVTAEQCFDMSFLPTEP